MIKRLFSTLNKYPISITKNAWVKMAEISNKQKTNSFLFSATSGGCNGFNYELTLLNKEKYEKFYESKIKPTVIEKNKTKVLIEPMSEILLIGTTVDYIFEDYDKGIFENKFIFITNQDLASSCGCGISFTPK